MHIRKAFLLLFLLISTFKVFGQWMIEAGYQNFRTLDQNASPLLYVANNGSLGFRYEKINPGHKWDLSVSVSLGSMQSKRFGQRSIDFYTEYDIHGMRDTFQYVLNPGLSLVRAGVEYSYKYSFGDRLFLGAALTDRFYYGGMGADTWFLNQLILSPQLEYRWQISPAGRITGQLSIPVLSYLLRQNYTLDPSLPVPSYLRMYLETGSLLTSLNRHQQVDMRLHYSRRINSGHELGLSYSFTWFNVANYEERSLRAFSNTLCLTYTF